MKYYSTNRKSEMVSFDEALLHGIAPDRGLYLPENFPNVSAEEIISWKGKTYAEIAFEVMKRLLEGDIPEDKLKEMCEQAYNFEVPLEKVSDGNYVMRLDRGPTASFKDFAARLMARLMDYTLKQKKEHANILVATSGDTGSAVANAFHKMENINVVVLFPEKEVSQLQRKQMTTLGENITALAVQGKFDDCQAIVKEAFSDAELEDMKLSSANSINIGRLLPQSVYYFYAYAKLAQNAGDEIVFSVPSGNLGNSCAGIIAKRMGLPVKKFVIATNENDEFPRFLERGFYEKVVPSKNCLSNSMNVGHPSNLTRIVNLYHGWMDETGKLEGVPKITSMNNDIYSLSVSDDETIETMKEAFKSKLLLEPHGAVAWNGLQKFLKENDSGLNVSIETAHPSKFPETVKKITGKDPEPADCIRAVFDKQEKFETIANKYCEFKGFLKGIGGCIAGEKT